ncbi:Anoctamin-3 [Armadillidium vulgare]|nr:Anoctamin-3 [Armadillidium vulgare]
MYGYSKETNLEGYILNTLSVFNVSEFQPGMGPNKEMYKSVEFPEVCYYRAYRNPPEDENPYEFTLQFWHVFTARLAFIIIFEHVVFILTGIVAWAIPDIPVEIKNQIKMEKKVEKETLFQAEMKKIREERSKNPQKNLGKDMDLGDGLRASPSLCGSSSSSRAPSRNSEITLQDADS